MEKKFVTEQMHPESEWFERARKVNTIEDVNEFITELFEQYKHDYGTECHAIAASGLATAYYLAYKQGITGMQASAIMWDFIKGWRLHDNKTGLALIDYDDMLYPQYENHFKSKTIKKHQWEALQKEAYKNLTTSSHASLEVIEHWKNICRGIVPFGYKIAGDIVPTRYVDFTE